MKPRVLLSGASGQLARAIQTYWTKAEILAPPESVFDLSQAEAIHQVVRDYRPDIVLNAGAFTQVDRCESEKDLAMTINGHAVAHLAEACTNHHALLIQISTDYVFDGQGTRPYREDDPVGPASVYGESKLLGEHHAAQTPKHLIVRTAWLYDAWGKNFLLTMLNAASQGRSLKVVADQHGTPTTCRSLARQLEQAIQEGWQGLVHGTCQGQATWHDFAAEIFRQANISAHLTSCTTAEYPTPAQRPAYSVLDGSKRRRLGTDLMPEWQGALAEVVADIKHA